MARSENGRFSQAIIPVAIVVIVAALYFAREILIPLALALLLTFLLTPLASRLERLKLGRIASVLITVVLAFGVLGLTGWIVTGQLIDLARKLPDYRTNIQTKVERLRQWGSGGGLAGPTRALSELGQDIAATQPARAAIPVEVIQPPATPFKFIRDYLGPIMGPLANAGIVIIFVIFMLIQRDDLRDRLIRLVSHGQLNVTTQALDDAAYRISRYLLMQLIVNVTYGVPIAIGLALIGVPNAFLWGLLATLLRFLPYVGPWVAAAMPLLLTFAVFDSFWPLFYAALLFIVIELISNNAVEPWLYGSSTGLSSLAVLVSAVFWTWLWGPIGLLLATPLTVCIVVIGKYVPQLRFLDVMLSDEPVFEPHMRVYQRLLAWDADQAADLIDDIAEERDLRDVYDTVLIPALAMAEQDHHRGRLDDDKHRFVLESIRAIVEDLGERLGLPDGKARSSGEGEEEPADRQPRVICLPASDEADELVAAMLVQALARAQCPACYVPVAALASEMVQTAQRQQAKIVCISALPPAAVSHARYLCKRLWTQLPGLTLIVGAWNTRGDSEKDRQRLTCGPNDKVVHSLADAEAQIKPLATLNLPLLSASPTGSGVG